MPRSNMPAKEMKDWTPQSVDTKIMPHTGRSWLTSKTSSKLPFQPEWTCQISPCAHSVTESMLKTTTTASCTPSTISAWSQGRRISTSSWVNILRGCHHKGERQNLTYAVTLPSHQLTWPPACSEDDRGIPSASPGSVVSEELFVAC